MTRMHGSLGIVATFACAASFVGGLPSALGQEVLINPPSYSKGDPAKPMVDAYVNLMQPTFAQLDALITNPSKDVVQAAEQVNGACGAVKATLEQLAAAASPKGKPEHKVFAPYQREQAAAWAFVCARGSMTARTLAMMNDTINIWETNWIPKLRAKKKKFRSTAGELNRAYDHVRAAAAIRSRDNDAVFEKELSAFKPKIAAAEALGNTVADLQKFLVKEVADGNPDKTFKEPVAELLAVLSLPPKPLPKGEGIWLQYLHKWRDLLFTRNKQVRAAYDAVVKESLSIRDGKLFRTEVEPIKGLAYKSIGPAFRALYDDLLVNRNAIRAKAEAEEKRWAKDRRRIVELNNETGPYAERLLKLKAARATAAEKYRAADLARARAKDKAEGEREYKRAMAEIDQEVKKIDAEMVEFEKQRKKNEREVEEIKKENARRRDEIGLSPRPLFRPS